MVIYNVDCNDLLSNTKPVKAIFLDPPDNIGLGYDQYKDKVDNYYEWLQLLLYKCFEKSQVIWLSYNVIHDLEIKSLLRHILRHRHPSWEVKNFVWVYTFGQYSEKDCSSCYRPIIRLTAPLAKLYFDEIRIDSVRMEIGDKRAAGPKIPSDVWDFPRIVGNCKERRSWHPTQHPEQLVKRMMLMSCNHFETWLDCFAGTGTSFRVGQSCGRPVIGSEISRSYCDKILEENPYIKEEKL